MVLAVGASLAFLLFASDAFFTRAASRELIQQDARSYVADAVALETAYREGSSPADAIDDVLDLVDSMQDRLGIDSATLLGADGKIVQAPRDANLGSERGASVPAREAPKYAEVETQQRGNTFEFTVPIHLGGKPFTLQVREDGKVLQARVSALRNEALIFSAASLVVGMLLFYGLWREIPRPPAPPRRKACHPRLADRSRQSPLVPGRACTGSRDRSAPVGAAGTRTDRFG